ncbi:hypothetical protein ABPG74_001567 [Tetrahymena malaccensis]
MLNPTTSTLDLLKTAKNQFQKYDTQKVGTITSIACIDALEHMFSQEMTQTEIKEIKSSIDEKVDPKEFGNLVIKLKSSKKKIPPTPLDEEYIIENFSLQEIKLLKKSWERFDETEGFLNFENTRKCIEYTLTHYKNSKNNDSEIKKFFINKAADGKEKISYCEYLNFISHFIKYRKLSYKKPTCSCFGF